MSSISRRKIPRLIGASFLAATFAVSTGTIVATAAPQTSSQVSSVIQDDAGGSGDQGGSDNSSTPDQSSSTQDQSGNHLSNTRDQSGSYQSNSQSDNQVQANSTGNQSGGIFDQAGPCALHKLSEHPDKASLACPAEGQKKQPHKRWQDKRKEHRKSHHRGLVNHLKDVSS